jgi:hypothetical protein
MALLIHRVEILEPQSNCREQAWLLKNSLFVPNSQNLGDRKCIGDPSKSIVGHPDAILFLRNSRGEVFQQPQAIALKTPVNGSMSVMGIYRDSVT